LANDVCTRSQLEECTSRKSGRFWSWASMKWWAAHGRVAEPPSSAYGPYCRRRGHAEQTARVIAYARNPIEPVEPRLRPMAVTFAANDNIPKTARAYARPRPISRLALRLVLITSWSPSSRAAIFAFGPFEQDFPAEFNPPTEKEDVATSRLRATTCGLR
jgi:hypothetical protein